MSISDELVVFPDAVTMVVTALGAEVPPDVAVHGMVPTERPLKFVTVERVGGIERDVVVDQPMLSIGAWAQESTQAYDIAALCRAVVKRMVGHIWAGSMVYSVDEVGGMQNNPDPVSDQPRYTWTVQLTVRGSAI